MTVIEPGRYVHYKGGEYVVIGIAHHSETEEEFVVYKELPGGRLRVRPKAMFVETVEISGRPVPRFRYLGPE